MLALNKTKAALPGRLSHYTHVAKNNSTAIGLVNLSRSAGAGNYGKSPQHLTDGGIPPSVTAAMARCLSEGVRHWLTPPIANLGADGVLQRSAVRSPNFSGDLQSAEKAADTWQAEKPADQPFLQPFSTSPGLTEQSGVISESNNPVWYKIHRMISAMTMRPGRECSSQLIILSPSENQTFGSMPRDCSSLRIIRLIHADTDASPSCASACLMPSSKPGSTRNAICLLPLPLISMVDIWLTPDYFEMVIKCMTGAYQKATPRTVRAVPRRLTKPLTGVTIMAGSQHTQTHPEFTWRFLAVSESHPQARAVVVYTNAPNEAEARSQIKGCVLYFAARLPAHHFELIPEVRHV